MAKEGRFCGDVNKETGEICNALMIEKAAHFRCPKCGHVELLSVEEINAKAERERKRSLPGQLLTVKHSFATEEGDVIGQA